jgi:predicted phosphoribosyltransferase
VLNPDVVGALSILPEVIEAVAAREQAELDRPARAYRDDRPAPDVRGKTVIPGGRRTGDRLDGARGRRGAARAATARLVIGVPTAAPQTCAEFQAEVNEIVCAITPNRLYAVGA